MNPFNILLLGAALASPLYGLDADQLATVSKKFDAESGDVQYQARLELNKLVDEATAPGKNDRAEVNRLLLAALASDQTPDEAKKYILRVLSKVGTATVVPALTDLLYGGDPLFQEEARRALELIPGPASVAALEAALADENEVREQIGYVNSLAIHKADSSVPILRNLILAPDADLSRAAINALGRIASASATETLGKAYASDKVSAAGKVDIERALLYSGQLDSETAALVFKSTTSEILRLAAFRAMVAGELTDEKIAALEAGIKSENAALRQAALRQGLESSLPSLQQGLAQAIDQLDPGDRLIVLANIHRLQPAETAEQIALSCIAASDEAERIAALTALGQFESKSAFVAILQAVGSSEPRINQAAGSVLAQMNCPDGETVLLGMLKGDSSDDRVLAVKAVAYRQVPDANAILMSILMSDDKAASREAMKTVYASATLEDLAALSKAAQAATDDEQRRMLSSICKKIASRLKSDEANKLVAPLK